MNLPTIDSYCNGKPNAVAFTMHAPTGGNTLRIYYSYQTVVAFAFNGKCTVRENEWGSTTAKHLAAIDGGEKPAKLARLPEARFIKALAEALESWGEFASGLSDAKPEDIHNE